MVHNEVDGDLVLAAPRHNDVRVHHGRRDVVVEGGLHVAVVLLQDAADVPGLSLGDAAVSSLIPVGQGRAA